MSLAGRIYLVEKEDDLRSKEEQYVLMQQLWREKEAKVRLQLNERDKGKNHLFTFCNSNART